MSTCMSIFFAIIVQLLRHVRFFATPNWTASHQDSLCFSVSQSLIKFTSIELLMLSNHFILCRPLLLLPSIFPSIIFLQYCKPLKSVLSEKSQESILVMSPLNLGTRKVKEYQKHDPKR